jgi:putative transport protein
LALKLNFVSLCGLLAGSMTDPPALAFANSIAKTDAPSVAYASVYPLTMLLRIMAAQLIVLLCGS